MSVLEFRVRGNSFQPSILISCVRPHVPTFLHVSFEFKSENQTSGPKERHDDFRYVSTVVAASSKWLEQGHAEERMGDEATIVG